mgnify:CR=1 FL=1
MYKILLSIIILSSNTVLAMDGMHNHDSHNHNKHQDMTYVDGSKTKITDEMFLISFPMFVCQACNLCVNVPPVKRDYFPQK